MGLFSKRSRASLPIVHPAEQYFVRNELTGLKERLDTDEHVLMARLAALEETTGSLAVDRQALQQALDSISEFRGQLASQEAETGRIASTVANYVNGQFEHLSSAVEALDQRLATLDGTVSSLAGDRAQLQLLLTSVDQFQRQVGDLQRQTGDLQRRVELPDSRVAHLAESLTTSVEVLHRQLGSASQEIDRVAGDLEAIRARVECALDSRAHGHWAEPSPFPPPALGADKQDAADTAERLAELGSQLTRWIAETDGSSRQTAEHIAAIDQRLTNISVELVGQLTELSRDISALAERQVSGNADVPAELIAALTERQVQLANEQARYEIAFRRDLAALAEDVHRAKGF